MNVLQSQSPCRWWYFSRFCLGLFKSDHKLGYMTRPSWKPMPKIQVTLILLRLTAVRDVPGIGYWIKPPFCQAFIRTKVPVPHCKSCPSWYSCGLLRESRVGFDHGCIFSLTHLPALETLLRGPTFLGDESCNIPRSLLVNSLCIPLCVAAQMEGNIVTDDSGQMILTAEYNEHS